MIVLMTILLGISFCFQSMFAIPFFTYMSSQKCPWYIKLISIFFVDSLIPIVFVFGTIHMVYYYFLNQYTTLFDGKNFEDRFFIHLCINEIHVLILFIISFYYNYKTKSRDVQNALLDVKICKKQLWKERKEAFLSVTTPFFSYERQQKEIKKEKKEAKETILKIAKQVGSGHVGMLSHPEILKLEGALSKCGLLEGDISGGELSIYQKKEQV